MILMPGLLLVSRTLPTLVRAFTSLSSGTSNLMVCVLRLKPRNLKHLEGSCSLASLKSQPAFLATSLRISLLLMQSAYVAPVCPKSSTYTTPFHPRSLACFTTGLMSLVKLCTAPHSPRIMVLLTKKVILPVLGFS